MMATAAGVVAINMYVPSLPAIAEYFDASDQMVQLTLTVFMALFAISQLVYGPLADRYGRKPIMAGGLAIFCVANLLALSAQSIEWLLAARVLQAIGACSGLVLTRAMVRDVYDRSQSARIMAYLGMGGGISSSIAPLLGGGLQSWTGDWRANFIFMTLFGLFVLVILLTMVRETLPQREVVSRGLGGMMVDYWSLLRTPEYMLYSVGSGLMNGTFFVFLPVAPFILREFTASSPERLGIVLMFITGGFFAGNLIMSRIGSRVTLEKMVLFGSLICLAGVLTMTGLAIGGARTEMAIALPMMFFGIGNGFAIPPSSVIAVSVRPQIVGTASALYGFNSFALAALCTFLGGFIPYVSQVPVAMAMTATCGGGVLCFVVGLFLYRRRETAARRKGI